MNDLMEVSSADLEKIHDALRMASQFLWRRDAMNAMIHLAPDIRMSPLTSQVWAEYERICDLLGYDRPARR